MNLNLPKFNCVYFRLTGQCTVPEEREAQIIDLMSESHFHRYPDASPRLASFGSKFTSGGVAQKAGGTLLRRNQGGAITYTLDISYEQTGSSLPRPPRDYKPLSALIDGASEHLGSFELSCHSIFEYERSEGYFSKVSLPIPLVFPDPERGATHIEGIEFSLRDDEGVRFRNLVNLSEDQDTITHIIHFETSSDLSRKSLRSLRDRCRSISTRFLV